jgi:excisionase family DNA binding protein
MSDQLLTIAQVAEQLSVGRTTVYRYIAEGLLGRVAMPGRVKGKHDIRVRQSVVDRFIDAHTVKPKARAAK